MRVVRLGSKEWVVGLQWQPLPANMPEARGIKQILAAEKSKGARFGVVLDGPPVTLGLAPAGSKKPKLPSAAAMLALTNQRRQEQSDEAYTIEEANWIVVEPIGDGDQMWFVAIKEGTPVPSTDMIDRRDVILQEVADLLDVSSEFTVISSDPEVRRLAATTSRTSDESIDVLLGDGKEKTTRAARFKRLSGHAIIWGSVAAIIALLIGAWMAFGAYQEKQAQAEAAARAAAQQQAANAQIAKDKQAYQVAAQDAAVQGLRAGVKEVEDLLGGPHPHEVINSWMALIEGVDLYQSGWNLVDGACVRDTPVDVSCRINLDRGQTGVNRILAEDRPDIVFEGDKAHYMMRAGGLSTHPFSWHDDLPTTRDFMVGMLSDLQAFRAGGITHTVEESKEIVKDVALPAPPASMFKPGNAEAAAAPSVQIQMGVATGKITLRGKELWQVPGVVALVNRPNVVIKSLDVKFAGTMDWSLVMDYYVRSKPQPVMPMITTPEGPISITLPPEYAARVSEAETGTMAASSVAATDPTSLAEAAEEAKQSAGPALPPPPQTFEEEGR